MLQPPPTIRLPRPGELPNNPDVFERLKARESANIVQGFTLNYNSSHDLPFKFYAEINIDNCRLWQLFNSLAGLMPDTLSCIYNLYQEDAIYSDYVDKTLILSQLDKHKTELTEDCNLEFGLIYHTEDRLEEIFVSDSKFIKVWGSNESEFRQTMIDTGLVEIPDLNFIDEFPKVVEPLTKFNDKAKPTDSVIQDLNDFFSLIEKINIGMHWWTQRKGSS